MSMRLGSLFAGYGGLELGIAQVLDVQPVWHSEIDPGACRVLAHHWPDVPNHGDITAIDWTRLESVDVLCGGFPCQDVSFAGGRRGLTTGTRTGLWAHMADAINQLRPRLVVAENVRGLLSADADSNVEPCPWCVGDQPDHAMRALGAVLADLADLGYDARWCGLRAADVGAPHGRYRIFITAWPADTSRTGRVAHSPTGRRSETADERRGCDARRSGSRALADAASVRPEERRPEPARIERRPDADQRCDAAADTGDAAEHRQRTCAQPRQGGFAPSADTDRDPVRQQPVRQSERDRPPVPRQPRTDTPADTTRPERQRPQPADMDAATRPATESRECASPTAWGTYGPAIRRWETVLGRPAPPPTIAGQRGSPRLSGRFCEWLMGLPDGWITDVPGVSNNDALRLCGNGVVPAQAAAAITHMLNLDHLAVTA